MVHHYPMAFKAIRLDSGSGLSATFVPGAGMICVSLVSQGEEHLDQRGGLGSYVESANTMGLPILYPWANRLARDSWKFGSQPALIDPGAYRVKRDENGLAIHGTLAASSFWKVATASADENLDSASLKASLDFGAHPELLETFPFPHRLELEFRLADGRLTVRTSVTPTGDLAVPLAYGFHPYLTLPDSERGDWTVQLPDMTSLETDSRQIPTGNSVPAEARTFTLEDQDLDDAFTGVGEGAEFSVSDSQTRITVTFERGYRAAQVYAPADGKFICFEPMKAPTNALVSGRDLTSVRPGQTDVSEFTIEIGEPLPPREPGGDGEAATGAATTATGLAAAPAPGKREQVVPRSADLHHAKSARYRLGRGDPASEVRRVARGRVDSAVSSLRQSPPKERAEAIHTARKDMKKLRSVLTLVRGEIGKKTYRKETEHFGGAAKLLSDTRDAEVLATTLASVLEDCPDDAPTVAGLVADLDEGRRAVSAPAEDQSLDRTIKQVADDIEAGGRRIDDWPLTSSGWGLFEAGLERSYRGGRKALATVDRQADGGSLPEPGKIHTLRKRVKELWYELRLLRNAWPEGLKGPVEESGHLADLLGDYNDLSILLDEIDRRRERSEGPDVSDSEDLSVLVEVIEGRQSEILEEGLPIARRLYAEESGDFTVRIGSYWTA
jgi:aldose 1-epimerase